MSEQSIPDPRPCPFCGHVGISFGEGSTYRWGIVQCNGCEATRGDFRKIENWKAQAVADWNERAADAQIAALTARVAELEKDAARYRFLRDGEYPIGNVPVLMGSETQDWSPAGIDAAIDEAMKDQP